MMSVLSDPNLQSCKLGELVSFKTGKLDSNASTPDGAYPFFTCSRENFRTDTYAFDCEAVLLAGNNAAGKYPIKFFKGKFNVYQRTYVIRTTDEERLINRYLFYALKLKLDLLRSISTGAATKFLTLKILKNLDIKIPPVSIQRRISKVLSAYDDLIENNKQRIQILEEIAQRIYKEWFVHFRFPGHEKVKMVDSELGRIPDGWKTKKVKSILKRLKNGTVYKQKDVEPSGSVVVIDQSRAEFLGFHNNEADHKASSENPVVIFGDHTCKMQLMVRPFSLGPNTIAFVSPDDTAIYYLYWLVNGLVETREYKRHWGELTGKVVPIADSKLADQFSIFIQPFFEKIEVLIEKNRNLRQTRDLLLPKLISGKIDVAEMPILEELAA